MFEVVSWFVFVGSSTESAVAEQDEIEIENQLEDDLSGFFLYLSNRSWMASSNNPLTRTSCSAAKILIFLIRSFLIVVL